MAIVVKHNNNYRFNQTYVKLIINSKKITKNDLMKLFNKSQAAVYARMSGNKMLTLEEGFKLANLLNINIYELFAPTQEEILNRLCNNDNRG